MQWLRIRGSSHPNTIAVVRAGLSALPERGAKVATNSQSLNEYL